jgi:hypothetical protein
MKGIAAISEDGVIFGGGEQHAIIFATGYRTGYQNFLHPDDSLGPQGVDPSIYFVGFTKSRHRIAWEISKEAQSVADNIAYRRGTTP